MTNFFREIYANQPYNQYILREDDPLAPVPATKVFGLEESTYMPLSDLDSYELSDGEYWWMDPDKTRDFLTEKLSDSHVVFLFDREKNCIEGIVSGKRTSVREVFATEEMKDPLLYSTYPSDEYIANEENFYHKVEYHLGLGPDDEVFYISNMSLHPEVRGSGKFEEMMKMFFQHLSDEELDLIVFEETSGVGTSYTILQAVMERTIYGMLENGHPVCAGNLRDSAEIFLKGNYRERIMEHLKEQKTLERQGYLPSNKDNPKIRVMETQEYGRGVFAVKPIMAGEVIAQFVGERYWGESAIELPEIMVNHAVQVGEHQYVYGQHGLAELINHSCDPNCGIKNLTEIVAMRNIFAGEQICWDYRMTEDSNWELTECLCGAERCTGYVGPFDSLPEDVRDQYVSAGMVSEWILEKYNLMG